MMHPERGTIDEARRLADDLQELRNVAPPDSLLPAVLVRVGLGDAFWRLETPIGPVFVASNAEGVSAVDRAEDGATFARAFRERFGRRAFEVTDPPAALARTIGRYLDGSGRARPRFDLRGLSAFERSVLDKALAIPRGEVRPYDWIAREIGRPKAARAVGSALGRNPVPLLIPCHRVVRGDGLAGDYVFGRDAKRTMLTAEGVPLAGVEADARAGVRYHGSDTTKIFCFPTCRNARRITDDHRVPFGSVSAAVAAGYRPCLVCRPAAAA
jgi:O-6-methylguanine DNA methyltransferase